jgi:hypothetical protein
MALGGLTTYLINLLIMRPVYLNDLKDMGMDISLAKEAASMSLDAELAILFCTDEDVQHRERENHRAAVLLNQTTRGTRSSGARHAVSSLREPLNKKRSRARSLGQ